LYNLFSYLYATLKKQEQRSKILANAEKLILQKIALREGLIDELRKLIKTTYNVSNCLGEISELVKAIRYPTVDIIEDIVAWRETQPPGVYNRSFNYKGANYLVKIKCDLDFLDLYDEIGEVREFERECEVKLQFSLIFAKFLYSLYSALCSVSLCVQSVTASPLYSLFYNVFCRFHFVYCVVSSSQSLYDYFITLYNKFRKRFASYDNHIAVASQSVCSKVEVLLLSLCNSFTFNLLSLCTRLTVALHLLFKLFRIA
jgi:hypothetical protein